jgi:hypothetical protein
MLESFADGKRNKLCRSLSDMDNAFDTLLTQLGNFFVLPAFEKLHHFQRIGVVDLHSPPL